MKLIFGFGIVVFSLIVTTDSTDPCDTNGHTTIPNKGYRYVNFQIKQGDEAFHDSRLPKGWYNVGNEAMPESPPSIYRCGTKFPIWLNGHHPTGQHEVTRQACVKELKNNCSHTYDVRIKRCPDGTFVYYLNPTDDITQSYCFGVGKNGTMTSYISTTSNVSVDINTTWIGGYPMSRVFFKCIFTELAKDPLHYRVTWWSEDNPLYNAPYVISKNDERAYLTEELFRDSGFKMGKDLSCTVRAFTTPDGPPGKASTRSPKLFVGIKVLTPTLSFKRNEPDKAKRTIKLLPMVPIGCQADSKCSVPLFTSANHSGGFSQCTASGVSLEDKSSCGTLIHSSNYSSEIHIVLTTTNTDNYVYKDESYDVYLRTEDTTENIIWHHYELTPIKVHIPASLDKTTHEGKSCYAHTDPHMKTFDGRYYDNHHEGTFTLYTHVKFDVEVQIKHERCNSDSTYNIMCPCGIAARAGRDRYVISVCNKQMDIGYKECGDKAIVIKRTGDFEYKVVLPHGTYVKVNIKDQPFIGRVNAGNKVMEVDVIPSIHDDGGDSRGLCGRLDNNCVNDFHHKDKLASTTTGNGPCNAVHKLGYSQQPHEFINEWKITSASENLFDKNYNEKLGKQWTFDVCFCENKPAKKFDGTIPCVHNTVAKCTRGKTVGSHSCTEGTRSRRSVHKKPTIPTVPIPETSSHARIRRAVSHNLTIDDPVAFCNKYMGNSPIFSLCNNVPNARPTDSVDTCAVDIELTGGSAWAALAMENMRVACVTELERNLTLQETDGHTPSVAETIEEKACPNNCSEVGICVKGLCECDPGYGASDCSIDLSTGPTISGLLDHGLCDEQQLGCHHAYVFGSVFTDSKNLTCRLEEFTISRDGNRTFVKTHYLPAEFETLIEVICPLRKVRRKRSAESLSGHQDFVFGYAISVSNDGNHFQDGHDLFVYNSECQLATNISGQMHFVLKDTYCFLDNTCVPDGGRGGIQNCSVCQSNTSPTEWVLDSSIPGCENLAPKKINTDSRTSYLWVIGVVGGVVVGVVIGGFVFIKLTKKRAKKIGGSTILRASSGDIHATYGDNQHNSMASNVHFNTNKFQISG